MHKDDKALQKHTLNLYEGDYEKLRLLYPDIGAGAIIRRLVNRVIEQIEATGGIVDNVKVDIGL